MLYKFVHVGSVWVVEIPKSITAVDILRPFCGLYYWIYGPTVYRNIQSAQSVQRLQSVGAHVGQLLVLNTGDSPDVGVPLLLRRTAQDDGYRVIRSNVCVNN